MSRSIVALRRDAADCRRCELWKLGTQTVFGEGSLRKLMLVGEQPGDVEDRRGPAVRRSRGAAAPTSC